MKIEGNGTGLLRPGGMRELLRLAAEALAVGLFVSLVLGLAAFIVATTAEAAETPPRGGALMMKQADGEPVPAPLLLTDVAIDVSAIVARTKVTQRFVNPSSDWREGVYVFPLPEGAAVDHMELRIGQRRIEGQIRERAKARETYEAAKREGRKAALVEQERPNVFTTSVAPIGPDEEVTVSIEYQETLRYDEGTFGLRFPMVVAPRYVPGTPLDGVPSGTGFAPDTDAVPDASRVTPPVVHPSVGRINPVSITIDLAPGFPVAKLSSPWHPIDVVESADHRYRITLKDGVVPADRDFELRWTPEVGAAPGAAVFVEAAADGTRHALVMVLPTPPASAGPRLPREATFVIDTSGSMAGTSIVQAKEALMLALDRLQPGDRFNVIEFNSRTRALFTGPMPVDPATVGRARAFVTGLKADGGTEMKEALETAFAPGRADGFLRQVVFLTDGAVGNEDELFSLIERRLDDRRLFTVGIGSAPNSHFMTKAAQFGRGTFTYIGDVREVQSKMASLFRKLERPVLTDVSIQWPGRAEAWPRRVPDLYAGEPIVVTAALDGSDGDVVVRGLVGGEPWHATLPLGGQPAAAGVGVLWARAKIEALADAMRGGANEDDLRQEIVRVALAHHLVSRYTSLVAVDVTPTMPADASLTTTAIPTNLPQGMVYESVFGGLPQTATPASLRAVLGLALILLATLMLAVRRRGLQPVRMPR